jgi:hypothetical protein
MKWRLLLMGRARSLSASENASYHKEHRPAGARPFSRRRHPGAGRRQGHASDCFFMKNSLNSPGALGKTPQLQIFVAPIRIIVVALVIKERL